MPRFPIKGLQEIEGAGIDPGLVSATMMKLIFASREFAVKVYDSDSRSGIYVIVLEGSVDVGRWERVAAVPEPIAGTIAGPVPENGAKRSNTIEEEQSSDEHSESDSFEDRCAVR
jgi:hypothetical protein